MGAARSRLRRWHVWLGWIVGLPILMWVVSGLVMVARPIEEVRGAHLVREGGAIRGLSGIQLPATEGRPFTSLKLEPRAGGARWIMVMADGTTMLFDPRTGRPLPRLSADDAAREVAARYTGTARTVSNSPVDPRNAPIEYRRESPAWLVKMSDGTHFYVDAATGEIVARRTGWWRVYDFMWGLHIMDPTGREDTHNPWVIGFGAASFVMALLALLLLPMTTKRRRRP